MKDAAGLPSEIIRLVRSALAHLYDYAYLQTNPLAALTDPEGSLDRVARAQRLRRLLVDCIEALKPPGEGEEPVQVAARSYPILSYRYIDGLSMAEAARKRALSLRQAYREHEVGIKAVAALLWEKLRAAGSVDALPIGEASGSQIQEAQAEVARLRQAVRPESLDLRQVLGGVVTLLGPLSQRMGTAIGVADSGPWPSVVADRVMLRQALVNLLTHALDAIGPGQIVVTAAGDPGGLRLDVAGSGAVSPLPPAAQRQGVGLRVAEALLEAQGGRLSIGVEKGGWRAQVLLPAAARTTILAIDDNAELVSLMQRYLGGYDVTVVGATDAQEALRLASELHPQLITLDLMMPAQDGWEILQSLKSVPGIADIPVVVCSVLNEAPLAETMGASDYITKPVSQADLLAVLRRWLGPLRPAA